MTTSRPMPASIASTQASLVKAGGTKTTDTSAPVSFIASSTEPNTGSSLPASSTEVPALRALTPPTMLEPASSMSVVCFEPMPPVMPWTMILLSLLRKIDISLLCSLSGCDSGWGSGAVGELGGLVGRTVHRVDHRHQGVVQLLEDRPALLDVVAVEPDDERLARLVAEDVQGAFDAVGDLVARRDPAEDVDEDASDQIGRAHV